MNKSSFAALCAKEHSNISYRPDGDYRFSKQLLYVPISAYEIPLISRHYPILFVCKQVFYPVAILLADEAHGGFVDANGMWNKAYYLPSAIKNYPFDLQKLAHADTGVLLFDKKSSAISFGDEISLEYRLFDTNRKPTKLLQNIAAAQAHFYDGKQRAEEFSTMLANENLLIDSGATIKSGADTNKLETKLYHIDENAYRKLPSHLLEPWFRANWLDAASLIIASQNLWRQQLERKRLINKASLGNKGL